MERSRPAPGGSGTAETRPARSRGPFVLAAALAVTGGAAAAAAVAFAVEYRRRAGFPARRPPLETPADYGLAFETVAVPGPADPLPGWFIPAGHGQPGPAVVLVHGWESNRARMLPNALFLHAAGFHTLMFDIRGHGENQPEMLPISGAEFGADTAAAVRMLQARPDVTQVGILGHSMGAAGSAIAAASTEGVGALVLTSTPAHARRLTRRTFQLAGLRIPELVAVPLAWLTLHVFLRPRGHAASDVSADRAVARYAGPILLVHGTADEIVPVTDLDFLETAASSRPGRPVERLAVEGGFHRWLYEDAGYRERIAAFLARHLGGPMDPGLAGRAAAALEIRRPADTEGTLTALERPGPDPGTEPPASPDPPTETPAPPS